MTKHQLIALGIEFALTIVVLAVSLAVGVATELIARIKRGKPQFPKPSRPQKEIDDEYVAKAEWEQVVRAGERVLTGLERKWGRIIDEK